MNRTARRAAASKTPPAEPPPAEVDLRPQMRAQAFEGRFNQHLAMELGQAKLEIIAATTRAELAEAERDEISARFDAVTTQLTAELETLRAEVVAK